MHERSLVRALLRQVHELQTGHQADRVIALRVSIGEFSGVEADLFQSAFDDLVDGSSICGARLELHQVALEASCESCSCEFAVKNYQFKCPSCGIPQVQIVRGDGMVLESVTLE